MKLNMENDISDMNLSNENVDLAANKSKSESLKEMSEQDMSHHLELCLKLAAENKINVKNAFSLHLIGILRHRLKQNSASDLQAASLTLQAGSKIYGGRIEALYKDTFAFHNQLQTVVLNKKVVSENKQTEDNEFDDDRRERNRPVKSKRTYVTTEESIAFKSEDAFEASVPHMNFVTIKSAFTASRTAPKLLEGLLMQDDSNKIFCTTSASTFKAQVSIPTSEFQYSGKRKNLIEKVLNLKSKDFYNESALTSSDVFFNQASNSPPPSPADNLDLNADDSFCIGTPPVNERQEVDVQEIVEKFSVLDITADAFANDLSLAVVDGNTLDRGLLPPNSIFKKILNTAEKSRVPKTPRERPKKEKAEKEPFFNKQRVVDKSILKKGRKTELTDNDISKWQLERSSKNHKIFSSVLAERSEDLNETKNKNEVAKVTYKLLYDGIQSLSTGYFCKKLQLWNNLRRQANKCLVRPSSFGVCLRNESDSDGLSNLSEANSNCIVKSFQNLSINNPLRLSDEEDGFAPDTDDFPDTFSPEIPRVAELRRNSGFFDDDLKSVMVTPPELVRPVNMKIQIEPITLNTEKVKGALWNCIKQNDEILLSRLHENLKSVFPKEKLPLQYTFTMLLLLANEKCLLLENVSTEELKITKDISEVDSEC